LRRFPFDTQVLQLEFQPFFSQGSEFHFAEQALPATGISRGRYAQLGPWQVKDLRYFIDKVTGTGIRGEANRAVFQMIVKRRAGFYVWKVFVPLLIMTMIPSVVFWIDVKEFDWMLKVPMTMLLSMVAFEFVVSRDLPKIGYVTLRDAVFLASFIFCAVCIAEILVVFILQRSGQRALAERSHRSGRWSYPLAYFSAPGLLTACFLQ
jgi:hypothetical protein